METLALTLLFSSISAQFDLPPKLLDSVCYVESRHKPHAVNVDDGGSPSLGLCQVKLKTARWLGFEGDEADLMEPRTNAYYAGKYLAYQLKRYRGDKHRAVTAYNRGNAKFLTSSAYSTKVIKQFEKFKGGSVQVIDNEMVCMFDVDETLVCEQPIEGNTSDQWVDIWNPYTKEQNLRLVHNRHVELLKHMHGRGRFIGVWSGNGAKWAESVIRQLGLTAYVHVVMTKPITYVDDLPAEAWLNNRLYYGGDSK